MSSPTPDVQDAADRFRELVDTPQARRRSRAHFESCLRAALSLRTTNQSYGRYMARGHIAMLRAHDILDNEQGIETRPADRQPPRSPTEVHALTCDMDEDCNCGAYESHPVLVGDGNRPRPVEETPSGPSDTTQVIRTRR